MSTMVVSDVVTVESSGRCGLYTSAVGDPVCRRISSFTGHKTAKPT
jgi:predicted secreted protein